MAKESYLLHPQLFASIPCGQSLTARLLQQRVGETLADAPSDDPGVSVVVRAFNEAATLEQLFEDIHNQVYSSGVEVVVVDNGSTDRTPQVAKYYGAEVANLPQNEFSYPKSLNLGLETASNELVFLTVAHTRLSNVHTLHAGARHFTKNDDTAGAFGIALPNEGASYIERWSAMGSSSFLARPAKRVKKAGPGVLAANGAMIAKSAWHELGRFDERYQAGGEDTAFAKAMLANGFGIVQEPALTFHHSHGLGLRDTIKQRIHWRQVVGGPRQFDRQEVLSRRPDLRANRSTQDLA
jgi:GT2 family glycosyltransferase